MSRTRSAEIVGGGFAGLAAACALAQRGWRVRLHERAERLRTAGAGINVYENGLRVLEALGALEETLADNARHLVRETRDQHDRLLSTHPWHIRVFGVLRPLPKAATRPTAIHLDRTKSSINNGRSRCLT